MNKRPTLSVVILTKNQEKNISICLNSLFGQSYKDFEVIVIDANSRDNTANIAKAWGCRVLKEEGGHGFGFARNLGINASRGILSYSLMLTSS
jgi:glycosyltransferase involved in cell wall biosynthesis